jgi:HSP20 family protein
MLTRWNPFREMRAMSNAMDRLIEDNYGAQMWSDTVHWGLALDVAETTDEYLVCATVPGLNPDDLEITFTNQVLTIKGEYKEEQLEGVQYHLRERRYGTFGRSVTLPALVQSDAIRADYENGILTLHLPKAEEIKPKRIQIHASPVLESKTKK